MNKRTRLRVALIASALLFSVLAMLPGRAYAATPTVVYKTYMQTYGWRDAVKNGATAGMPGKGKQVEAIKMSLRSMDGDIVYAVYGQGYGWQSPRENAATAGTVKKGKRVEAIRVWLDGNAAGTYDVSYRVYKRGTGWTSWVKNHQTAGKAGDGRAVEAMQVKIATKPRTSTSGFINYNAYVQSKGWMGWKSDGATHGTTGKSLRLEALKLSVNNDLLGASGSVKYRVHGQTYGWQAWKPSNAVAGNTTAGKRVEAVEIKLTGDLAKLYDVWYRVHIQRGGWLGWTKNGKTAGSVGKALRMEALQIRLVAKGGKAPGSTAGALYTGGSTVTPSTPSVPANPEPGTSTNSNIMGTSNATQAQVVRHYKSVTAYPNHYNNKGAASIEQFVSILFEEAKAEGVRADVVYAQAMLETNYLRFGGDVLPSQCNFAGIGATGGGVRGNSFPNVRTGLRAQVQHLKAYASTKPLVNECVDPRFGLVERGVAPTVELLSQRWATGSDYGNKIMTILNQVDSM